MNNNLLTDKRMTLGLNGVGITSFINERKPLTEKMGIHAWTYAFEQDNLKNDGIGFQLIKEHGFKFVRMVLSWKDSELESGKYDLTQFEELVKQAVSIGLVPVIVQNTDIPQFYTNDSYLTNRQNFLAFYEFVLQNLKSLGVYWESFNEPNGGISWFKSDPSTDDFIEKLIQMNNDMNLLVKKIDSTSPFISGAIASDVWNQGTNPWKTFSSNVIQSNITQYSDLFSHHPYITKDYPETFFNEASQIKTMQSLLINTNVMQAVTEIGWSTTDPDAPNNEADKTAKLLRTIFILDYLNVDLIGLFNWHDLTADDEYGQLNPKTVGFGLIDSDLRTDLDAGANIKDVLNRLKNFTFEFAENTKNNDFVYHYRNYETNSEKIVYWSKDGDFHTNGSKSTTISLPSDTIIAPKPQIFDL